MGDFSKIKGPDDFLDYELDWAGPASEGGPWLEDGETITNSGWAVTEGDATIPRTTLAGSLAVAWVAGGTVGTTVKITNTITTSATRIKERSITIRIAQQ